MASDSTRQAALEALQKLGGKPLAPGSVKTFNGCAGNPALLRALGPGSRVIIKVKKVPTVWIVRSGNCEVALAVVMPASNGGARRNVYLASRIQLRDLVELLAERSVCQEGDPMPRYAWAKIAKWLKCSRQKVFNTEAEALKFIGWVEVKK